jgi:MoaA/NifB/PqqE/SkfB family radical SAM enzyme
MHEYNESLYHALFGTHALSAFLVASIDRLSEPNYKHQNSEKVLSNLWKIRELARDYSDLGNRGVQIHSVISRENFNEFPQLIEFCAKNAISLSLAMVEPLKVVEKAPSNYNEFTTKELQQIVHNLRNYKKKSLLKFPNQVLLEYLEQYLTNNLKMHHCMAGKEHVIIESDGQVYPCLTESYHRGLTFGNIIHEDFKQIYTRMRSFRCHHPLADTCWDHFLWNRLGEQVRRE